MKVFIYSHAPWSPSGYGTQTLALAKQLITAGKEVSVVAVDHKTASRKYQEIEVLPTRGNIMESPEDLYYWASLKKPNKIIQLFDAWVIGHQWIEPALPVLTWNPVDCLPLPRNFVKSTFGSSLHIAMSRHAEEAFKEAKLSPNCYIPHAIDTSYMKPSSKSRARKTLRFPQKAFIFGLVGTNLTARKNIPGQLLAFKKFLDETSADAYLYLHTAAYEILSTSFDVRYLVDSLGLTGRVIIPNQHRYLLNDFNQKHIKNIYNAIDVLLSCSYGEGFGLPIIEAGACGTPSIVTNFSAMPDVAGEGALLVDDYNLYCDSGHMAWWAVPSVNAIKDAMVVIYGDKILRETLKHKAIENGRKYDWQIWLPRWLKVLES